MALFDNTVPYETLIRFGEDGVVRAAHQQRRRTIVLDDVLLKDDILPAEPLDLAGLGAGGLMDEATERALVRITSLEEDNAALRRAIDELTAALQDAQAKLQDAQAA